ncbi:lysylphosphatidylglycerol synthase transmembrane domain-containing protein [Teredinibacter purpureus]|uniref:lysylphosphatidylglycerol synthase transmembrane domain-containing protein n=1 Tax=Teredinibacter purpureus TaxID=2731756 RepID=UPI0005F80D92|nr:lysylphosphatidylglycerol synthase transmembrane domain-containing protein [Teredinibacter purpureus]
MSLNKIKKLAGPAILLAFFAYLMFFFLSDIDRFSPLLNISPNVAAGLLGLSFLVFLGLSVQQYLILLSVKCKLSFSTVFLLAVSNTLLNYLPLKMGLVAKGGYLKFMHKLSVGDYLGTLASGQLLWILLSALIGAVVGFLTLYPELQTLNVTLMLLTALLALSAVMTSLLLLTFRRPYMVEFLGKVLSVIRIDPKLIPCISISRPIILLYVVSSGVLFGIFSLRVWCSFAVVGVDIDFLQVLFLQACLSVSFAFSFVPGNLGLKEGAFVALSAMYGLDLDGALLAALIDRAASLSLTFLLGPMALARLSYSVWLEKTVPPISH